MFSPDQNVVSVFNGEIYNFKELRNMYLNEYTFHSNSDAEVIPYLYDKFGIDFIDKLASPEEVVLRLRRLIGSAPKTIKIGDLFELEPENAVVYAINDGRHQMIR